MATLPDDARVVAFLQITLPHRARAFYQDTLGMRFLRNDGYALVFEWNGNLIRAGIVEALTPAGHTVLGWEVPDIAMAVENLQKAGIIFRQLPGTLPEDSRIWIAPDGSKVAWFQDPDGNWLSVSQHEYAP